MDRARVFAGYVDVLPPTAVSTRFVQIAATHAATAFGMAVETLPRLHERHSAEEAWDRTCRAREALVADPLAKSAAVELAESLGFVRATLALDAPRLRVVSPHAHTRPSAARAFYAHRDTWYGSPRAQVNVWVPLFDVDERDSFAIHVGAFGASVENDSETFDYATFARSGGFQSAQLSAASYPRAMTLPTGEPLYVRARAAELVVFSPAHLHATTPNVTDRTRLSVDVRFVDLGDHKRGEGAPDVDNRSHGTAIDDYSEAT